ncbi:MULTISPECIES: hypothetical protein [unclassified Staphylococcus]|uniref:hypothetical protein n=1 Tax=unclassified Staphylococcus TaxID=91994 RepID=UPI0021CF3A5E|nr:MULTISPECIES: hypothetical protein [unclassified Staphylococcus]UXR78134.1 hypothetical protein MUA92_09940 [Staphylococcus sp. IVB6227]UXR82298.1 hypothetical protein MUA51_09655 [Staphylococcus sp. IVB6214]
MLKKLTLLFLALVITTTIAETYLIAGTWQYLLMQSFSLSIIGFFVYNYVVFRLEENQASSSAAVRQEIDDEPFHKGILDKNKTIQ